ncbi:hypothetical protein EDD21DRAFT_369452 [Dissophora ornata]|nr:hypothetical protein EDD21DRAFT_369452 [Dissophora ornata]
MEHEPTLHTDDSDAQTATSHFDGQTPRRRNDLGIGGKQPRVLTPDSYIIDKDTSSRDPLMDHSITFLSQPVHTTPQTSRLKPQQPPVQLLQEDEDNPFLISRKPASRKKYPVIAQGKEYREAHKNPDVPAKSHTRSHTPPQNPFQASVASPEPRSPAIQDTHVSVSVQFSSLGAETFQTRDQHGSSHFVPRHPQSSSSRLKHSDDKVDYSNATVEDLKKARKELKSWEASFKARHGRTATQEDIAKDEAMVKRYRAYGKIKKALGAKQLKLSGGAMDFTDLSRNNDPARTPTKQSRTQYITSGSRTPTRKKEVEFVSPRRVVNSAGFMSPSRGSKNEEERLQFLASIASTTPNSQRIGRKLTSPSGSAGRRSLLSPTPFNSSPGLFAIREQVKDSGGTVAFATFSNAIFPIVQEADSDAPFMQGFSTPSRMLRTPTSKKTSSLYLPNPFQSPSRPRMSPLFGGMNNRRSKRPTRPSAPVINDLEPVHEHSLIQANDSLPHEADDVASDIMCMKSPLLSTPQKSGAAKVARSLFRRSSVPYPTSPSIQHSVLDTYLTNVANAKQGPPTLHRNQQGYSDSASVTDNPFSFSSASYSEFEPSILHDTVHVAMDSMSLRDRRQSVINNFASGGRIIQGFDIEDQCDDGNIDRAQEEVALYSPVVDMAGRPSNTPKGLMTPTRIRSTSTATSRTPSQQPSLTFSQPTPGSAKSEVDIFVVPPGFHSHYRRRQVRSTLFIPSQEEDEQFEREFLGLGQKKASDNVVVTKGRSDEQQDAQGINMASSTGEYEGQDADIANEADWEEQECETDSREKNPFGPERREAPRKRYTQKRTTRLHRIAVAPSEKALPEKAKKTSTRSHKTAKPVESGAVVDSSIDATADQKTDSNKGDAGVYINKQLSEDSNPMKLGTNDESSAYGWANSNKPMVKSDRRMPGIGLGRAGPRRPTTNKYGSSGGDGNFVAYNLQRGGFRKGGARGRSRFGNSKFGGNAAAGGLAGTGRTHFDTESWRTEFDSEFTDATLALSIADGGMGVEDEDDNEDGMPWYGNVNDIMDPYVVTISRKYLKAPLGDVDDPDEYIKALELQGRSETAQEEELDGFRVNLEYILKKVWGYRSFRDGQLDSVKRVLRYESSLLVLPTGSGKSLSYQLPAYIFSKLGIRNLTLVISPMISLMYDQVKNLPPGLTGACWTSVEQSASQFKDFMEKLTSNAIKILFISPEKLQSQSFLSLVRTRRIPRISFLCVDEVHCLSEWSHNFRPAYLLLNHVLKTDLKSPCVLGLTGTATEGTKDSICTMLDIDRLTGVLSGAVIRENLAMTASLELDREPALLNLLQSPRFATMDSILIYVMKQAQADALAGFLRVRNFSAESYHAGKSPLDRQRIQQRFMNDGPQKGVVARGKLGAGSSAGGSPSGIRILVATIAFGLGLNKSNIRSVIHYCMPKSLENYIQEIGRSGRDGERSYCHMFLNQEDYLRLRSLAYADGMDWGSVLRLIKKLFSRKGIVNSTLSSGSLVKTNSKKRRPLKTSDEEEREEANEDDGPEDGALAPGTKKRKQNDRQPLKLKTNNAGNGYENKQKDLVTSTASILVIPPMPGVWSGSGTSHCRRLVVVREELVEEEFDIKKEVLATLLSYIELDISHAIKVMGSISAKCTVKFLQTSEALTELADKVPLVEMIMKQGVLTGHNSTSGPSYQKGRRGNKTGLAGTTLSMAYCCDTMSLCQQNDMTYTELIQELQLWKRKKWVVFEMTDPSLCVEIRKEPVDYMTEHRRQEREALKTQQQKSRSRRSAMCMEVDDSGNSSSAAIISEDEQVYGQESYEQDHDEFIVTLADRLHRKLCAVERVGVAKVDQVYELFQAVATPTWQQQEVFKPRTQSSINAAEESGEDGAESSEYDEDVDPEYIQMRARAKAQNRPLSLNGGVSESEMILRDGIQEYFARQSGEGIGGLSAEQDLFHADEDSVADAGTVSSEDKTIQLYNYENTTVSNLQRKWRSAVEVDLKVFLNQQWQQQQQQSSSEYSGGRGRGIDSPRVVSRIFHGISSPCYPALEWSRQRYWSKYVHFDFAQLMQMADRIIKEQRQQRLAQQQHQQ